MSNKQFTVEQILIFLIETPSRLAAVAEALEPKQLRTAPEHDEWSVNDVLAHLRSCADVWGCYIARILAEDTLAIQAVSPRTWIKQTNYPDLEYRSSLQAYTMQRADLLKVLEPLPPEDWERAAEVTSVGRSIKRTVLNYAERLARHERSHYKQIENIVDEMHASQLSSQKNP